MPKKFPSKILLFGEYSILNGSSALAVPLKNFSGHWIESGGPEINRTALKTFATFLADAKFEFLDAEKLISDLEQGLNYDSNIPIGYGMGSSGSVSAAIYSKYGKSIIEQDLKVKRDQLSKMENFFHGNSSGLDPLVSFTNSAILKKTDGSFKKIEHIQRMQDVSIFLMDTLQSRSTAPLVKKYRENLEDPIFKNKIEKEYIPCVEETIQSFLHAENQLFFESLKRLSMFQYEYFQDMILEKNRKDWSAALSTDFCKLKLCGAGGGGYILGFTKDKDQTETLLGKELLFVDI